MIDSMEGNLHAAGPALLDVLNPDGHGSDRKICLQ
jgi:hypothetical protein